MTHSAPVSWDGNFGSQILQPLHSYRSANVKGSYFTATSTTATSTFPLAQTTNIDVLGSLFGDIWTSLTGSINIFSKAGSSIIFNAGLDSSEGYLELGNNALSVYPDANANEEDTFTIQRNLVDGGINVGIGTTTPGTILSVGSTTANYINIDNFATSTFSHGININDGCFAILGTCVGGGGGTPGGSDTQVQFNDGGVFGGDTNFYFNKTTDLLSIPNIGAVSTAGLLLEASNGTDVGILGASNTANATWYGTHNFNSGATTYHQIGTSGVIFNEDSQNVDFRIESDNQTHLFFLDASVDNIGIGDSTPDYRLDIEESPTITTGVTDYTTAVTRTASVPSAAFNSSTNGGLLVQNDISGTVDGFSGNITNYGLRLVSTNTQSFTETFGTGSKILTYGLSALILDNTTMVTNADTDAAGLIFSLSSSGNSSDTGTVRNHYGIVNQVQGNIGTTGTMNKYGTFYSITGTADNNYGVYLNAVSGATTNYGIYMNESSTATKHLLAKDSQDTYFGTGEDVFIEYTGSVWNFDVAQATSEIVFNNSSFDTDFRVESDGDTDMLFVNAGTNRVGISTSSPSYMFDVDGAIRGADYYSEDGTQGVTATCSTAITAITVKDGLITSITCP